MRFETIHAVTYFGAESAEAAKAIGLDSWWKGYFAFRGAPLGYATPGVYDAAFHSFSLPFVRRWVPALWESTTPEIALVTRSAAAASTLRRVTQAASLDLEALAAEANPALEQVLKHCFWSGRPLFATNRDVALPPDPVARLWQLCTSLREHRGDGHVVAATASGLSGLEAHVLIAVEQQNSFEDLARTRGWSTEEWNDCLTRLQKRGLVSHKADWGMTEFGEEMRQNIETMTDQLATQPFNPRANTSRAYDSMAGVVAFLDPLARVVAESGTIRYPNPMGLPTVSAQRA
jgi:hypothetical protein